jgi:hypothetical protein
MTLIVSWKEMLLISLQFTFIFSVSEEGILQIDLMLAYPLKGMALCPSFD